MEHRIKQRHLNCFLEIVRCGSVGGGAEALNITQSAASRTLGELEQILGARLMERNRGGIALTSAGETFLRHVSASVTALNQGLEQIAQMRTEDRRSVIVGVLPNAAARILPNAVLAFKDLHPGVPVTVHTGNNAQLMQSLRVGNLDLVIGRLAAPEDMAGLAFSPLYHEHLAAVVRADHRLLDPSRPGDLKPLAAHTFLIPLRDTIIRREAEQMLISAGLPGLPDVVETVSSAFARAFVLQSDAIWIAPWGAVESDVGSGLLRELALDVGATRGVVGISTRRSGGLTPLAAILARAIREAAPDT